MKRDALFILATLAACCTLVCCAVGVGTGLGDGGEAPAGRIVDHEFANVNGITAARIANAKEKLVVAYWHTSHGSQLLTGISGMDEFYGDMGWYTLNGTDGLKYTDCPPADDDDTTIDAVDLGNPNRTAFEDTTRRYLDANRDVNVVMWSWCGQAASALETDIDDYLARMSHLETDYPNVTFVYMTGHASGSGLLGNLHLRDQQIRDYCEANGKWLYDFYDIECYDPDGVYYGDKHVTDGCNYDYNGSGTTTQTQTGDPAEPTDGDRNWATDWQSAHSGGWWSCSAAHTKPLNANQKAKAVWQLWCAIADGM